VPYIEPRIDEDTARRTASRTRFGILTQLFHTTDRNAEGRRLPYLEQIYMPYYWLVFDVVSPRGPGQMNVSVEGYSGAFAFFEMYGELREGDPPGTAFAPSLTEEEVGESGRRDLLRAILTRRGGRDKPVIEGLNKATLIHYPLWVYYFARGRRIDIRVVDAVSGERVGVRTRRAVLEAFLAVGRGGSA
jgi:hypothetical protein